mmetsp:Transcript_41685/g.138627  ORF Transcript_41685/g.138627 Transcript_41685/m.138627 type:complete len:314 (-) Transcript_41685:333-1274(-)
MACQLIAQLPAAARAPLRAPSRPRPPRWSHPLRTPTPLPPRPPRWRPPCRHSSRSTSKTCTSGCARTRPRRPAVRTPARRLRRRAPAPPTVGTKLGERAPACARTRAGGRRAARALRWAALAPWPGPPPPDRVWWRRRGRGRGRRSKAAAAAEGRARRRCCPSPTTPRPRTCCEARRAVGSAQSQGRTCPCPGTRGRRRSGLTPSHARPRRPARACRAARRRWRGARRRGRGPLQSQTVRSTLPTTRSEGHPAKPATSTARASRPEREGAHSSVQPRRLRLRLAPPSPPEEARQPQPSCPTSASAWRGRPARR